MQDQHYSWRYGSSNAVDDLSSITIWLGIPSPLKRRGGGRVSQATSHNKIEVVKQWQWVLLIRLLDPSWESLASAIGLAQHVREIVLHLAGAMLNPIYWRRTQRGPKQEINQWQEFENCFPTSTCKNIEKAQLCSSFHSRQSRSTEW